MSDIVSSRTRTLLDLYAALKLDEENHPNINKHWTQNINISVWSDAVFERNHVSKIKRVIKLDLDDYKIACHSFLNFYFTGKYSGEIAPVIRYILVNMKISGNHFFWNPSENNQLTFKDIVFNNYKFIYISDKPDYVINEEFANVKQSEDGTSVIPYTVNSVHAWHKYLADVVGSCKTGEDDLEESNHKLCYVGLLVLYLLRLRVKSTSSVGRAIMRHYSKYLKAQLGANPPQKWMVPPCPIAF